MLEHEADTPTDEGAPAWMVSFCDLVVLMLCFFVLLLSFARTDPRTFRTALGSVRQAFGSEPAEAPPSKVGAAPYLAARSVAGGALEREERRERALTQVRAYLAQLGLRSQVDVSSSPRGVVLRTRDQVLFESGEATIEARGRPVLDAIRGLAEQIPGQLAVEGHSDDQPIQNAVFPSNWELSGARSAAVLRYLLAANLDPARVHVAGYADTRPLASNATDEGRAQNRRVEFVFEYQDAANED